MFITDLQWPATYCSGFLYAGWLISSHCIVCYYLQHYIFLAVVLSNHSNSTFYLLSCILTYIVQCKHLLNLEVSQENVSGLCKTGCNSYVLLRCLEKVLASEKPLSVSMSKNNMHCAFTKIVVNESELSGITQPLTNKDREVNLGSKHLSFQEKQKTDDHPSPIHHPSLFLSSRIIALESSFILGMIILAVFQKLIERYHCPFSKCIWAFVSHIKLHLPVKRLSGDACRTSPIN